MQSALEGVYGLMEETIKCYKSKLTSCVPGTAACINSVVLHALV